MPTEKNAEPASPFPDEALRSSHPSVEALARSARRRIPGFAFDYLTGGCHHELNLARNTTELRQIRLAPHYLDEYAGADLRTKLFDHTYSAPFGVAPIGLQGMIWPGATEILAAAAHAANLPFILSTVATASIETVAQITEGRAWFQLYHPKKDTLRDAIVDRVAAAGLPVLVLLADTPSFGYRPKEIRNGLSLPPRMTLRNVLQMSMHPTWALGQLRAGVPRFATLAPYLPRGLNLKHLGLFMNKTFSGRLTARKIAGLRVRWKGRLVIKGIVTPEDASRAIDLGADGLIVSNHGGRQHDVGESTVASLLRLLDAVAGRVPVMLDSGVRSGSDVACALGAGADFAFLGRTFMYGVGALGRAGGQHTMVMLKRQLQQVMEQIGCERPEQLRNHRIPESSQPRLT
ncbi:MAG: alpha-hydroxy acid oxidase [Myxococcota bacterium]